MGDRVWQDMDGDGRQDAGEPGIGGVTVTLYRDGVPVATTTTNPDGSYLFEDVAPGHYTVTFAPPDGYEFSPPNQGGEDSKVVDFTTGSTAPFDLTSGQLPKLDVDAGLFIRMRLSLSLLVAACIQV